MDGNEEFRKWIKEAEVLFNADTMRHLQKCSPNNLRGQLVEAKQEVERDKGVIRLYGETAKYRWRTYLYEFLNVPQEISLRPYNNHTNQQQLQNVVLWFLKQKIHALDHPGKADILDGTQASGGDHIHENYTHIKNWDHPNPVFQKTKAYFEIFREICQGEKVIQIYGFPGNGKTQIFRAISRSISKSEIKSIVWHIECSVNQGDSVLIQELKRLLHKVQREIVLDQTLLQEIEDDLSHGEFGKFIDILKRIKVPVLLVLEEISLPEKEKVQKLVRTLLEHKPRIGQDNLVQIALATHQEESIFEHNYLENMDDFLTKKISGFTKKEAKIFLLDGQAQLRNETDASVSQLAKELHFSPLQLTLARAYCQRYGESYTKYCESLGKQSTIIEKEKQLLRDHPELGKSHLYETIMKLVTPCDDDKSDDSRKKYEVTKMLSFMKNRDIPDILVGKLFQGLGNLDQETEERCVKHIKTDLMNDSILQSYYPVEEEKYGKGLFSIHKVVPKVINTSMSADEKQKSVATALRAMISLVHKDNRATSDNERLFHLMWHVETLVGHASQILGSNFDIKNPKYEEFEIQLGMSRLYEVLGFLNTQKKMMKDDSFHKALDYLWKMISVYKTGILPLPWFQTTVDKSNLFHYIDNPQKDPKEVAQEVDDVVRNAVSNIPQYFVMKYYKKFFPLNEKWLEENCRDFLGENAGINWIEMEETLKNNGAFNENQIRVLEHHKLLLTPEELQKTFLYEIISSILHSRSRQVLYLKNDVPPEEQRRYEWYRDVGLEVACLIPRVMPAWQPEVHSVFEYILVANNKLPRLLHNRENEPDDAFEKRLADAKKLGKKIKDPQAWFYENGMYRVLAGTVYTRMNTGKYIVKADTKIYKRPDVAGRIMVGETLRRSLGYCKELLDLAKSEEGRKLEMAANCRVQAGKRYAAAREYDKALEAMESAFDCEGKGLNKVIQKRPDTFTWGLHNYGMVIRAGRGHLPDIVKATAKFIKRYDLVMNTNKIDQGWIRKLEEVKREIEHIALNGQTRSPLKRPRRDV